MRILTGGILPILGAVIFTVAGVALGPTRGGRILLLPFHVVSELVGLLRLPLNETTVMLESTVGLIVNVIVWAVVLYVIGRFIRPRT